MRLAAAGLVSPENLEKDGGPEKRVFALTAQGEQALRDWFASEPDASQPLGDELYLKLMLALLAGEECVRQVIQNHRAALYRELHRVTSQRNPHADPHSYPNPHCYPGALPLKPRHPLRPGSSVMRGSRPVHDSAFSSGRSMTGLVWRLTRGKPIRRLLGSSHTFRRTARMLSGMVTTRAHFCMIGDWRWQSAR